VSATLNLVSREPIVAQPALDFSTVFRQQLPHVWRVLRCLGVPNSDLDDVCQEVFLVVLRKLDGFEGRSQLSTWIHSICFRVWSDYRKRAYRRYENPTERLPETICGPQQHREAESSQAIQAMADFLEGLDDEKRTVFVLYDVEQLTMNEVVEIVGCPLQTGYSRLRAARAHMRDAWKKKMGAES